MESLGDLLAKRQVPQEPAEIQLIKQYVRENFDASVSVAIKDESLIVTVTSAALAGALRMRLRQMQHAAQTQKRIVLRIR
jgi:hypothetical protein